MLLKRAIILATSLSMLLTQQAVFAEAPLWWKVGLTADQMFESQPVESLNYYRQAITEAKTAKVDPIIICAQIFALGKAQHFARRPGDAEKTHMEGALYAAQQKLPEWQSAFLLHAGLAQKYALGHGVISKADPLPVLQALKLRTSNVGAPSEFEIAAFDVLTDCYRSQGDLATAETYARKAIAECEIMGDKADRLADLTQELSLLRFQQGRVDEAKNLLALACKIQPTKINSYSQAFVSLAKKKNIAVSSVSDAVSKNLAEHNFAKLEQLANSLRQQTTPDSVGYLRVDVIYWTVSIDGLDEEQAKQKIDTVKEWVKKYPQSATAKIALANLLIQYAWKARGGGYSNSVSRESWKLMEQRLSDAWLQLQAVKDRPADWYRIALDAGLGLGWDADKYNAIYDECRKKYPLADEVIWSKAYWLAPRWHGRPGELDAFLNAELKKRVGPAADMFYAQAVLNVESGAIANLGSFDWARMKRGFDALCHKFPDDLAMKSRYFAYALRYGDSANLSSLGVDKESMPPSKVHDPKLVRSDFALQELDRILNEDKLSALTRNIEQTPESWEAYYNRARFFQKEDQREAAIKDCTKAIELSPKYSGQALLARCNLYKMVANYDLALADAEKFQALYPKSPAGFREHGDVCGAMENYRQAVADLRKCIDDNPNDLTAIELLTLTYDSLGDEAKAIETGSSFVFLVEQFERKSLPYAMQERALSYIHAHEYELALLDLLKGVMVKQTHSQLWAYVALAFASKGDLPKAIDAIDHCERLDTFPPRVKRLRGEMYRAAGKWKEAIECYAVSTSLEPDYGPGFMQKAIAEIAIGKYENAADDLKTALKRLPASAQCHALLAVVQDQLGKKEEAQNLLEKAFALTSNYAPNLVARARIHLHHGEVEESAKDCGDALNQDPFLAESYALASEIFETCGDAEGAKKFMDLAHSMSWRDFEIPLSKAPSKSDVKVNIAVPTKPDLKAAVLAGVKAAGEGAPSD